jgi:hypothetical protein
LSASTESSWFWEQRGEGEFLPPNIATISDGWEPWRFPLSEAPPVLAEIFVRELVQNFVDAFRENANDSSAKGAVPPVPSLTFQFVELRGVPAVEAAAKLGLGSLHERFRGLDPASRKDIRFGESDVLAGNFDPLRLLVVKESATTGMYGPWRMTPQPITRKMRSAVLATVGDRRTSGLGAYGEGKRAIIASSRCRSLLIYTCFAERPETDEVTRRLIGATYWRPHKEDGDTAATGLALMGTDWDPADRGMTGRPEPLSDDDADSFVNFLSIPGLDVRHATDPAETGTSHVFIDPIVSPGDVVWAIQRNWWPLILDKAASFSVVDYDGLELSIDLDARTELAPFIDVYRRMVEGDARSPLRPDERFEESTVQVQSHPGVGDVGKLGLMADISTDGWSWSDREKNYNLVAIIRDGMIIEYEQFPRSQRTPPPFVRGVFRTDSSVHPAAAELLRNVEPPLHNKFIEQGEMFDQLGVTLAAGLYKRLGELMLEFRRQFRETPPPRDTDFVDFGEVFDPGDDVEDPEPRPDPRPGPDPGPGPDKPTKPGRPKRPAATMDPWLNQDVECDIEADPGDVTRIRALAIRKLALKPAWSEDEVVVRIRIGWQVQEDGRTWADDTEMLDTSTGSISMPPGFVNVGGHVWEGRLTKVEAEVGWMSHHYPALWTVRPFVEIEKAP